MFPQWLVSQWCTGRSESMTRRLCVSSWWKWGLCCPTPMWRSVWNNKNQHLYLADKFLGESMLSLSSHMFVDPSFTWAVFQDLNSVQALKHNLDISGQNAIPWFAETVPAVWVLPARWGKTVECKIKKVRGSSENHGKNTSEWLLWFTLWCFWICHANSTCLHRVRVFPLVSAGFEGLTWQNLIKASALCRGCVKPTVTQPVCEKNIYPSGCG